MKPNQLGMSLVTGLAVAAGLGNVSCTKIDCGEGTVERDGACFPANQDPDTANCAPGTVLGPLGCEVEVPTQCDLQTTMEVFDPETGITTCVGTGGSGCAAELPCATPDAGKASLCGRIWDTETDLEIERDPLATGARCDPAAPSATGPCSLDLRFFDALNFAQNPTGAVAIVPEGGVYLDDCGRYRGNNMARATFGFIGIAVRDQVGTAARHRLTGVATSNAFASPGTGFRAYVTRNETDTLWTASTAIGGTMTLAERGVLAIVFQYQGNPAAGVQVRRNGSLIPNDDFYFADTGRSRSMALPHAGAGDDTGPNGTVLVVNSPSPIAHDGLGGAPAGCQWPSNLAASIPGVTFVQIKEAETTGGAACP